jgi:betaine-aldehyde dehydrogenase
MFDIIENLVIPISPDSSESEYNTRLVTKICNDLNINLTKESCIVSIEERLNLSVESAHTFQIKNKLQQKSNINILQKLLEKVVENREKLAKLESIFAKKNIIDSLNEVDIFVDHLKYAIYLLSKHKNIEINTEGVYTTKQIYEPVGVVSMIVPYNFPLVVVAERLPYALAAGCSVIIKPSEVSSGCLPLLVKIATDIGFKSGNISIIHGNAKISEKMVADDRIDFVSFTGSTEVGRKIAISCANTFKRTSLELGGNNFAFIDINSNLEVAAAHVAKGYLYHSGQCCISTRVVLVHNNIYDEFILKLKHAIGKYIEGNDIRELCDSKNFNRVKNSYNKYCSNYEIIDTCTNNYKIVNNFIIPTVFKSRNDYPDEEIFGPLLRTQIVMDYESAISIINKSEYGLALQIFSSSNSIVSEIISRTHVGRIWVNGSLVNFPKMRISGFHLSGNSSIGGSNALKDYMVTKAVIEDSTIKYME